MITGLKDHQQSRLLQHYATIKSLEETLVTIQNETSPNVNQVMDYEAAIQSEKDILKGFMEQLVEESEQSNLDEWIDAILSVIDDIQGAVKLLPEDLRKPILAVLEQVEKALKFIKGLF